MVVRDFKAGDAQNISMLFRVIYGERYVYPDVYQPNMICQRNTQGEWYSAVAELGGVIVGHAALLLHPGKGKMAELAMCVVDPAIRHRGVATALGKYLCKVAHTLGLDTLTIKIVSSHPYTQRLAKALGFYSTALLRDYVPTPFEQAGRESVILGVLPLKPRPIPLNLLDYRHNGWIALLAEKFGAARLPAAGATVIPAVEFTASGGRLDVTLNNMTLKILKEIERQPFNELIHLRARIDVAFLSLLPWLYRAGYKDMGLAPAEEGQWFWLLQRGYNPRQLKLHCPIANVLQGNSR
ncbi:GNAT family N-acetyltransferase [Mixta theicola]|uniref:GNAT family N-acetyltransferase n=1 Tax=Mixta theicola TaxID=1458355 RepID=A0A2K1QEP2_9GAMM|nr:GNAT family N-acetyltransferase [Mixta theicola]PNS13490.1 GNAT family N-acetyltransferase [Mixta theicola]GLR09808.1 hypothetical protein GCM10007905_25280 [Mixta theicola]